jgi:GT2 family glycosyltransferase
MAETTSEDLKKLPLLSVVITSYTLNRLRDIYSLLDSIKKQTYPNIEVIFVVERSRGLYKKVKEYCEEIGLPKFKILWNEGVLGASAARNLGIKSAKGEIIAFVDDDAVLFSDWAENMIKAYKNDSIIGVTGPVYPLWEDPSMSWLPEEFHWLVSCTSWFKADKIVDVRNVWLENASFRREAFEVAGYLDTKLGPRDGLEGFKKREFKEGIISEEIEFSLRVREKTGKRIIYDPKVKIWHKARIDRLRWKFIIRWSFWMGTSKRKLKKLYKKANINLIEQEQQLLRRILLGFFPRTLVDLLKNPRIAGRKLLLAVVALSFTALGYLLFVKRT